MNDHWLAGLLEGEATFTWSRTPKVQIEMTDRDTVERAAEMMGARLISVRDRGHLPTYTAAVYGQRAIQVMARVRPMMGRRRTARIEQIVQRYYGVALRPVQLELWEDA